MVRTLVAGRERAHTRSDIGVTVGVILVNEEFSTRETWPMECLHCWHIWLEEYVVRHLTNKYGRDVVVWLRAGTMVQPPWSGMTCPDCGHSRVTVFPPGSRSYQIAAAGLAVRPGTMTTGRTTRPPVGRPRLGAPVTKDAGTPVTNNAGEKPEKTEKTETGPVPGGQRQPVLLYALLGSAFLLLTGFTIVEYVVMHH